MTIVMNGLVDAEGNLTLDSPAPLPPGPVQVAITVIQDREARLPSKPIFEDMIPAPVELPYEGEAVFVKAIRAEEYLPQAHDLVDEE